MGKTTQDEKIREDILRGNLWLVLIRISLPLVVFSLLNHIFKIFDSVIAAAVGSVEVSAVLYIHQIKFVFDSVSAGLSVGGAILIARYYGAHEDRKAAEASGNPYAGRNSPFGCSNTTLRFQSTDSGIDIYSTRPGAPWHSFSSGWVSDISFHLF